MRGLREPDRVGLVAPDDGFFWDAMRKEQLVRYDGRTWLVTSYKPMAAGVAVELLESKPNGDQEIVDWPRRTPRPAP